MFRTLNSFHLVATCSSTPFPMALKCSLPQRIFKSSRPRKSSSLVPILNALSILVDTKAQASPHLLPRSQGAFLLDKRTNLKNIRIVPPLFERGVRENETQRAIKGQQPFLILHNRVIGVIVIQRVTSGIFVITFFVLRKITQYV